MSSPILDKVALILDADSEPLIVPRSQAIETLAFYSGYTLTHESDQKLYAALQMALGDIGRPVLHYAEGDPTVAERAIKEWSKPDAA